MSVINTNLLSLRAQQNQGRASNGLSTSLERLASGLRVNGAKDDYATSTTLAAWRQLKWPVGWGSCRQSDDPAFPPCNCR
ncbi:hypothetical protein R5R73_09375 [Salinicola sp. LHM]|uniref:flagellin N-terminal helical domain-containing protein n=1 Tax=Salinicola sp. LHM TaxID=3065298 RepID=UPI002ACED38D|nr:hypothetical protein [Salinicola sp. LHM]WQH34868.1 hypothetical protein R5R73_09375 [Salinicola sp. LHM]